MRRPKIKCPKCGRLVVTVHMVREEPEVISMHEYARRAGKYTEYLYDLFDDEEGVEYISTKRYLRCHAPGCHYKYEFEVRG